MNPSLFLYSLVMASKVIAQIILQSTAVLSRAFFAAYQQALQSEYLDYIAVHDKLLTVEVDQTFFLLVSLIQ